MRAQGQSRITQALARASTMSVVVSKASRVGSYARVAVGAISVAFVAVSKLDVEEAQP